MLRTPIFITNFKTYESALGQKAVDLAKIHEEVALSLDVSVAICVSACDLYRVSQAVSIPVFAQHIDPIDYGSNTGQVLPQNAKQSGAIGTLLNHSERRISPELIEQTVSLCQQSNLERIICAESPEEILKFSNLETDYLAFEPPELIGTTKSVSSEEPASIRESVKNARGIPLLVGAGINQPEDIRVALALGAQGFLVASAITKAENPAQKLKELLLAMK